MRAVKKQTNLCFPTPIWRVAFEGYEAVNRAIRDELNALDWDRVEAEHRERFDDLHTFDEDRFIPVEQVPSAGAILDLFLENCREVASGLNWDLGGRRLHISSYWFHLTGPGEVTQTHAHKPALLSGVYYLSTPPNCGDIVFVSDNPYTSYEPPVRAEVGNYLGGDRRLFVAEEGIMLLFPSWLLHQVSKNRSGQRRMSLSFNADLA